MKRFLDHRRIIIFLCFFVTIAISFGVFFSLFMGQSNTLSIVAKEFVPGTKIAYSIFSDGAFLDKGEQIIKTQDDILALKVPEVSEKAPNQKLTYDIQIQKAQIDEMMDIEDPRKLILDLDRQNNSVTFKGSGFPEFSDILMKSGDSTKIGKTDWSGNFSDFSSILGVDGAKSGEMVELAFQRMGISTDIDPMKPDGVIEVFLGDSNGSSTAAVQARYSASLIMMTEQLSAVMMQQALIIGTFLDAKTQLETQRTFQMLQARAHKDYHPSDQMCRFGTFIRSVAATEVLAEHNKRALNRFLMDQYMGVANSSSGYGLGVGMNARVQNFITTHCDPYDSNGALSQLCSGFIGPTTPAQRERFNKDIDFTRTLDNKLTVDIDFSDATLTADEEDILTMANHLYFPEPFGTTKPESLILDPRGHYETRVFAAKMNVAHNSFINIVGMKSSAPAGRPTKTATSTPPIPAPPVQITNTRGSLPPATNYTEDAGWTYMKAMLREFGIIDKNGSGSTDDEIHGLLGDRPSYYAQMEVLTKTIYQNPDFYTNLYDKPANVARIGTAMDAISIMNQRDRYESMLRREMTTAVMVEEALAPKVEEVNARIFSGMQQTQIRTKP